MDAQIALILLTDGIANGAIYVLIALGTVLIFSITRVIFVPFGDIAGLTALTVAALQAGRLPGTVWLVTVLVGIAAAMEVALVLRQRRLRRLPAALACYAVLPMLPVAIAVALMLSGLELPVIAQMLLALLLMLPVAPLINRIVFQPMASASVLVLLIVAVALHFALSGLALLFFGPEGFRNEPLSDAVFAIAGTTISAQVLLMVGAAVVLSGLLFLYFGGTQTGKALRATAINRTGARLVGIRPRRTGAVAFVLASLLGGISGLLIGPVTTIYYDSGFLIGLKAFVAAMVGGLASYPATAAGAIAVGVLESFASFWNSTLKESIVFGALIPVLLWRSLISPVHEDEEEDIE
ncbi:MAG TPA: branched-chain amino acid ABC transporter permease [Hyphomicrobiaceae bacterium]|nr:branched-chain amino acid ABC transporter permease [Hyphomicrobiaceae bacterium]